MNNLLIKLITVCAFGMAAAGQAQAQNASSDTLQQAALRKTISNYYQAIGQQARLYNGPEYQYPSNAIQGNAFYNDIKDWQAGNVTYDNVYYGNEQLMYDVYNDMAVLLLPNKYSVISLLADKLESFDMGGHHFINITPAIAGNTISPGIYDQLYGGKVWALAKTNKTIQQTIDNNGKIQQYFYTSKKYYIRTGSTYHSAGSESSALNVFKDRKKELKQYIKNNNIKFRDNPELALKMIAAEYDRITN